MFCGVVRVSETGNPRCCSRGFPLLSFLSLLSFLVWSDHLHISLDMSSFGLRASSLFVSVVAMPLLLTFVCAFASPSRVFRWPTAQATRACSDPANHFAIFRHTRDSGFQKLICRVEQSWNWEYTKNCQLRCYGILFRPHLPPLDSTLTLTHTFIHAGVHCFLLAGILVCCVQMSNADSRPASILLVKLGVEYLLGWSGLCFLAAADSC